MQSEHDDDIMLAEEWALKAANGGWVEAMYWLGEGYTVYAKEIAEEDPDDSKAHFELAYYWLSKANFEKHPAATLELAGFTDVVMWSKRCRKSIALVKQAAEWGEVQAMRDLAFIYANGLGVVVDDIQADYWTQKQTKLSRK